MTNGQVKTAALAAVLLIGTAIGARAADCTLDAKSKIDALNAVQNLVGKYSMLGQLRGEDTLEELFAMKTEGVSWRTPGGPIGIQQMKDRFAHPMETLQPGVLHVHSMLTPVIEIAGDGKTAKGVWDSFGPNIGGPNEVGDWLWGKYGVDFVKEDGVWKIWHLQFYAIFNTPYNESITQSAKERAGGGDRPPPPAGGTMPAGFKPPPRPKNGWIYDGKSVEKGPFIPVPYCHFDTSNVYQLM